MGNIRMCNTPRQVPVQSHKRFRNSQFAIRDLALLLLVAVALPSFAQEQKKKDNDPNITVTPGWNLYYRPGKWMPLYFQIKIENPTDPAYEAVMSVTCQQDSITKMNVAKPVLVTKDLPLELAMVVKTEARSNSLDIQALMRQGNSVRWDDNVGVNRGLIPLKPQDMLIALAKGTGMVSSVGQLRDLVAEPPADSDPDGDVNSAQPRMPAPMPGKIAVALQFPEKLPDDWAAYDAVDLLVLQDVNWSQMTYLKQKAIAQWVRRGGRLLIVMGTNPMPDGHQLAALLPFRIGQLRTQTIGREQLISWNLRDREMPKRMTTSWKASDQTELPYWDLSAAAATGWDKEAFLPVRGTPPGVPWAVFGQVGFGHVGVLAFNPDALTTSAGDALPIWKWVIGSFAPPGRQQYVPDSGQGVHSPNDNATDSVVGHLLAIPELRPLSIWWVIGLLSALAMLLGPIDYFILKKLDRLPWTWITSTVIIVLFSVGAWYGVQKIRGGTLQVRVVSVLDGVQGPQDREVKGAANYYGGIFAPDSDRYLLGDPTRKDRDPNETQWWSAISPKQNNEFGDSSSITSRSFDCKQTDDGNLIDGVPISIWSMQCLLNEAQDVRIPLQVRIEKLQGGDMKVIVTNLSDKEIVGGEVRTGRDRGFALGRIPAQGTEVFEKPLEELPAWQPPTSTESTFSPEVAYFAEGTAQRTEAIRQMLAKGAAVVCVRYDNAPVPFEVAKRNNDLAHIQMVRMVVWPTEARENN